MDLRSRHAEEFLAIEDHPAVDLAPAPGLAAHFFIERVRYFAWAVVKPWHFLRSLW